MSEFTNEEKDEIVKVAKEVDRLLYFVGHVSRDSIIHNQLTDALSPLPSDEELRRLNARGKIILISSNNRGTKTSLWLKRFLDPNGILGIVSDEIEPNRDINTNQWLNGWTDVPGGWLMRNADSKNNFGFSISKKRADYLRNLIRRGNTVRVRAVIESRYYTNDTIPYITGCVKGAGQEGEEVLALGHVFEYGACNNSTGASSIIEAVGTLNDLIRSGVLPRPKRTIRVWHGHELYGSLAFTAHNIERMREKTIATINYPSGGPDYDHSSTHLTLSMNPDVSPSFTDAVVTGVAQRYISLYTPEKLLRIRPYSMGADSYFGESMTGIPSNVVHMGSYTHHNNMDTIGIVDPRTLHDMSALCAAYLYYVANADYEDISVIAGLTYDRGIQVILDKAKSMHDRLRTIHDGTALGIILYDGTQRISYYTEKQEKALNSILRLVSDDRRGEARKLLAPYIESIEEFGRSRVHLFRQTVAEKSGTDSIEIITHVEKETSWDHEAATLIPRRKIFGTLTLGLCIILVV